MTKARESCSRRGQKKENEVKAVQGRSGRTNKRHRLSASTMHYYRRQRHAGKSKRIEADPIFGPNGSLCRLSLLTREHVAQYQNANLICNSKRRLLAFSEKPSPLGVLAI